MDAIATVARPVAWLDPNKETRGATTIGAIAAVRTRDEDVLLNAALDPDSVLE